MRPTRTGPIGEAIAGGPSNGDRRHLATAAGAAAVAVILGGVAACDRNVEDTASGAPTAPTIEGRASSTTESTESTATTESTDTPTSPATPPVGLSDGVCNRA
jgi:hypothetical protein